MDKLPDMFVGFDLAKRGHAGQPNSILNDPEEFAVRIALHFRGTQVHRTGVHPAAYIHFPRPIHSVAEGAFHPVQLVCTSGLPAFQQRLASFLHDSLF
jgi:hypothetical protein